MDLQEKKDAGNRSLYGDVIVWKQVVEYGKCIEGSIILITDDLKEDWWYKFKGKTISPRPELIKEYKSETGKRINIYQADRFLEFANRNLKAQTADEAIEEVRKLRLADEKELEKHIRELEMLLEDNGDENYKENARIVANVEKSNFEKAIEKSIENK